LRRCGCPLCKAVRASARRPSGPGRALIRIYARNLLTAYRGVKAWFALTDRQVRRGLAKMAGGVVPIGKAAPTAYRSVQIADWLADWDDAAERGTKRYVGPHQVRVYGEAMGQAALLAKVKTPWNLRNRRAIEWAGRYVTPHMRDLAMETRGGLARLVRDGLDRGQSVRQVAREMRGLDSFAMSPRQAAALGKYRVGLEGAERRIGAALAENNGNMAAAGRALRGKAPKAWIRQVRDGRFDIDRRVAKEAGRKTRYRAEMIARTETARAVSEGTLEGYAEARVERVRWEAAGDSCDLCAGYDGTAYNRGEASGMIPAHPNCRCTWVFEEAKAPVAAVEMPVVEEPVEVPTLWKPAKNWDDAKRQFKERFGVTGVTHEGPRTTKYATKMLNEAADETARMLRNYPAFAEQYKSNPLEYVKFLSEKAGPRAPGKYVSGYYHGGIRALGIADDGLGKKAALRFGKDVWTVQDNYRGVWRHEFGHHVYHNVMDPSVRMEWNEFIKTAPVRKVSRYARTDRSEAFAESFSAYTHPDYKSGMLPKGIEDFLSDVLGAAL